MFTKALKGAVVLGSLAFAGFGALLVYTVASVDLDPVPETVSEGQLSPEQQRVRLQMFFPQELPQSVEVISIQSTAPHMGDGEFHARVRVSSIDARAIAETLKPTGTPSTYRGPSFEHARGAIRIDEAQGLIEIDWSEF